MMQLIESHTMNNRDSNSEGWQIHPTVNNAINPLCMLPFCPDASAIQQQTAARDTLSRASQALAALVDSQSDDDQYGQNLILQCITDALFHASQLLDRAADMDREKREISFAVTPEELAALQAGADRAGVAPEKYASTLVMERLEAMVRKGLSSEPA